MDKSMNEMNLHQLLINPTGPNTAFMTSRARVIEDLNNRYQKLLLQNKTFKFKIYRKQDDYFFVFKIPSEKFVGELFYDVVINFVSNEETKNQKTLRDYTLKLFSNSPAFTFTYAYVLNKNDMLIPFLKSKFSKQALTQPPVVKNPIETYGFEKSCYFACRFIQENNLLVKFDINNNLYLYSEMNIKRNISSDIDKLKEYNLIKSSKKKGKKVTLNKESTSGGKLKTVSEFNKKRKTSTVKNDRKKLPKPKK